MNPTTGGQSSNDSLERQRRTAAEIARKKVLAAYALAGKDLSEREEKEKAKRVLGRFSLFGNSLAKPNPTSLKETQIDASASTDWNQYHAAWQDYYKKYYNEYYSKAAKQYLDNEKLKSDRKHHDNARNGEEDFSEEQFIEDNLREEIRRLAKKTARKTRKHRFFIPILAGVATVLVLLFLQYNRVIFAPIMAYVSPSSSTDDGISAIEATVSTTVSGDNILIIPKLNINVPIIFGINNDSASVMDAMNRGVAHFRIPGAKAMPGEVGNLVLSGHSAGDIYSNNQYKFIFSGLERLEVGDMAYIDYQGVRYAYRITRFETVEPSNVDALVYDTDKPMLTLITCTPLGTSRFRLLVTAEQVSPSWTEVAEDPENPEEPSTPTEETKPASAMPENEPTFFERLWNWLTGN